MRSAERLPRALAAAAAAALLAGCGSVSLLSRDASGAAGTPAQAASAAASAPQAATVAGPAPASTGPIPAATQRAYDDALALLRAGHVADAERGFRALAQSSPELAGPHANLGVIARNAGRLPEAVAELEKATTLAPGHAVAWDQLGLAYRQSGEFTKSRDAYQHALAINPDYATAVLNLGVLEDLYLAEPAKALDAYTRYLALVPGDATVTKWQADVRRRVPGAAAPAASAATAAPAAPAPAPAPAPAAAPAPAPAPATKPPKASKEKKS
ncbi:MAG TPA: tetratricopeptide repeat protein [Burkholderiaceae bacterium]